MKKGLLFLCIVFGSSCQTEEADTPEIKTREVTGIGLSQAVLQATLVEVGPLKPVQYGFAWSTAPFIHLWQATTLVVGESASEIAFEYSITSLQQNTTYYYRAFLSNADGTVSGEQLSFTTSN